MWQGETLDDYVTLLQRKPFFWISNLRGVVSDKRVERLEKPAVQMDTKWHRVLHEPVEDEPEVPLCFGDPLVDDFGSPRHIL